MFIPNVVDLEAIKGIHDGSFVLNLTDPAWISKRMAIKDGRLIGFCGAKLTTEGVIILNKKESKITRIKAAKELWDVVEDDIINFGLSDIHVFSKNQVFYELL